MSYTVFFYVVLVFGTVELLHWNITPPPQRSGDRKATLGPPGGSLGRQGRPRPGKAWTTNQPSPHQDSDGREERGRKTRPCAFFPGRGRREAARGRRLPGRRAPLSLTLSSAEASGRGGDAAQAEGQPLPSATATSLHSREDAVASVPAAALGSSIASLTGHYRLHLPVTLETTPPPAPCACSRLFRSRPNTLSQPGTASREGVGERTGRTGVPAQAQKA